MISNMAWDDIASVKDEVLSVTLVVFIKKKKIKFIIIFILVTFALTFELLLKSPMMKCSFFFNDIPLKPFSRQKQTQRTREGVNRLRLQ